MSLSNPLRADKNTISANEPMAYPNTEIAVIKLTELGFFREKKYLPAMKNGHFTDLDRAFSGFEKFGPFYSHNPKYRLHKKQSRVLF